MKITKENLDSMSDNVHKASDLLEKAKMGAQKYSDSAETFFNTNIKESKFSWGLGALVIACIWALIELIMSVLYFF
jgi:hypothetical protein